MSQGKQTSTQTQTVTRNVGAPSLEEAAAQAQAAAQLKAYQAQLDAFQASPLYGSAQAVSQNALDAMNRRISGQGDYLSPSEQQYLDLAFAAPQRQAMDTLRMQAEQDAARRGLTLSDSPTGNEYLRQLANLQSNIASSRANAGLQLGQTDMANWQNAAPIGLNLQQQAQQNRLALQNQAAQFSNALAQNRIAAAPVTTTGTMTGTTSQPWSQTFGQIGQGAAGLFGSRDQSAFGGMMNLGKAGVDLFGNTVGPAVKNVAYTFADSLKGTPGANTVPYYGNVGNVPNYGSAWD